MKRLNKYFLAALLPLFFCTPSGDACTSIMVGRLASTDGSVITSHTCDGRYRTWAFMEPAADYEPGTMHQVLRGTMHTRFHGDTVGVKVMGEIPQVAHTYAGLHFVDVLSAVAAAAEGVPLNV